DLIIGQEAWDEDLIKIYNSAKIILNIHSHGKSDPNMRVFEAAACGGFLLTEERRCLGDFFNINKEILTFSDKNELKEKIGYYLTHEEKRKEIAFAGQKRVLLNHTYQHRVGEMVEQIRLL
ncbi:MAG: glycosyltransferase, partial [Elusimicrobia bacterium]|nr:glycosyltransferase [Elusimicrobiota bacterium]